MNSNKPYCKCNRVNGAGNEARTRYLHLGKVALYRMSYARISRLDYTTICRLVKQKNHISAGFSLSSVSTTAS